MRNFRDHSAVNDSVEGAELIQTRQDQEMLLDELSDWRLDQDDEHFDEAKLDALLDALEQNEPLDRTFDPHASLAAFHREHQATFDAIAAASETERNISEKKHFRFSLKKTLLVAALLAALIGLVSMQATGFDFGDLFGRWSDSVFGYTEAQREYATVGTYPIAEGETKEYDSLQAALDDFGVNGHIAPNWMPERFKVERVWARVDSVGAFFYVNYLVAENGEFFITIKEHDSAKQTLTEKDEAKTQMFRKCGIAHYCVSDMDLETVSWINGKLECMIYGNVSFEEMKQIVESIYGE